MKRIVWLDYNVPIRVEVEESISPQDALTQAKEKGALALRGFDPEFVSAEVKNSQGETEFETGADKGKRSPEAGETLVWDGKPSFIQA